MNKSLISVIIPVYNVEDYLVECIDSVLNQTYENIEIIIINDGSTDSSYKILKKYSSYDNIRILSQENSGQSVARNNGMKIAKGKYIYFLDSDDYILPNAFEELLKTMEQNNLDLIMFSAKPFADKLDIKINDRQYDFSKSFEEDTLYIKKDFLKINLKSFSPSPVLYIMKKNLLEKNNILFQPNIVHEDELFTLEVFLNTELMMYKSEVYYKRRYRKESTMTSELMLNIKKSFESKCIILDELSELLLKYTSKTEKKLINKRIKMITGSLSSDQGKLDKKYKRNRIKVVKNISLRHYFFGMIKRKIKHFLF